MDQRTKIEETFLAPIGCALMARDTRIVEREGWYQVITPSSGTVSGNEVVLSQVPAGDAGAIVRDTMATYAAAGVPFRWSVGPLTEPGDFGDTLEAHGFRRSDGRGMAVAPEAWRAAAPSPDVTVERITADTIDDFLAASDAGWERSVPVADPDARRDDHVRALATGRFHMFVARRGGAVVGSGGFITKARSAYLVGGVVLAEHRGAGVYRALLDERMGRIAALGIPLAIAHARESTSAPILARLGFETVFRSRMYFSPAAAT
ncbi:MAG: GNAT family N-acetyltransferase [Deltaproteobacteria bacterium]|nr:GNAT family N-acetyltransferase [Kofleriaceae bacterium]